MFGQIKPRQDFSWKNRTWGAFEAALRFSHTDLSNKEIRGGEMTIVMAGLNWYLSPYYRLMFNVGRADVQETDDTGDLLIFQTRLQVQF